MEIMCHQTARTLPPAYRQELGTARPEALTFLNGQAEPPRPPHYELPPQASWHKVLGQPRSSCATKPVMLQPRQSQPLQRGVRQMLRVQWGSTEVWGQTWLVYLFFKLSEPPGAGKALHHSGGPCTLHIVHSVDIVHGDTAQGRRSWWQMGCGELAAGVSGWCCLWAKQHPLPQALHQHPASSRHS